MILPDAPLRITGTRADGSPFDPMLDQQVADHQRQQATERKSRPALQRRAAEIQPPPQAVIVDHVVPCTARERGRLDRDRVLVPAHGHRRGEAPLLQPVHPNLLILALGHLLAGLRYVRRVFEL